MNTGRFTTPDLLKIIGSAVFVIFGLVNWVGNEGAPTFNAFEWPLSGTVPWILLLGVGIVSLLLALGTLRHDMAPWPLILLIAAGLATLLNLILVAAGPKLDVGNDRTVNLDRSVFLFIAFLGAVAATAGAVMSYMASRNETGTGARGYGSSSTPPPPPPSY